MFDTVLLQNNAVPELRPWPQAHRRKLRDGPPHLVTPWMVLLSSRLVKAADSADIYASAPEKHDLLTRHLSRAQRHVPFWSPGLWRTFLCSAARQKMFEWYAHKFHTVEINNTFYRIPTEDALMRWRHAAPLASSSRREACRLGGANRTMGKPARTCFHLLQQ
jgi:hypothetical protein